MIELDILNMLLQLEEDNLLKYNGTDDKEWHLIQHENQIETIQARINNLKRG